MNQAFIRKMVEQSMKRYGYELDWHGAEKKLELLCQHVQKRCASGEDLYEVIEDEVYAFLTNP
ncbi:YqzH family protein [Bacillus xiapuensis]|uniref:YqzH family protein n=1 Tax=Bacillus xiapuensis TaxID=2014075 RepID=UPI000C245413|nr:YqzH family protein [Bacillus xiapuensis]